MAILRSEVEPGFPCWGSELPAEVREA